MRRWRSGEQGRRGNGAEERRQSRVGAETKIRQWGGSRGNRNTGTMERGNGALSRGDESVAEGGIIACW